MARVSVVMPTTERRRPFLERALQIFERQTYQDSELVILEESSTPLEREWPKRVRYHWTPNRMIALGQKRNLVNELTTGEIIAHQDSDDWYHPERLTRQVEFLEASGKDCVGYRDILYFRTNDRSFWKYRYQGTDVYATGASLVYRTSFWRSFPFIANLRVAEDTNFWKRAKHLMMSALHDPPMIVAISHGENTFVPSFGQAPFLPAFRSEFPNEFLEDLNV